MKLLEIIIERKANSLNRPFTYYYDGEQEVAIGTRVKVNFNNAIVLGYIVKVETSDLPLIELENKLGFHLSPVIEVIDSEPLLNPELQNLAAVLSKRYLTPLISFVQAMLPPSLKPALSSLKAPKIAFEKHIERLNKPITTKLTSQQEAILNELSLKKSLPVKQIKSKSAINTLLKHGYIRFFDVEINRLKIDDEVEYKEKKLTLDQKNAINSVIETDKVVTLLEGVTGSGKTEVYLQLTKHFLNGGKNVIMLVPEIALTPMMVKLFVYRYGKDVAILHSELTAGEKYDEYRRIARGECRIVVGARSAVFAPLDNIGLIILDEEHVESYKQDALPFYHARDVAIIRATNIGAKVLLGSATPSLETRARAQKGLYNYVLMNKRINERALPLTTIVDMTKAANLSRASTIFSTTLLAALKEVIEKKEQAILLINRRGYSAYLTCRSCGHIFMCPSCGVALAYHKESHLLKCHHCGYTTTMPANCPKCGSSFLAKIGFGTERIIEEVEKLFPNVGVCRLDSDTKQSKRSLAKIVDSFQREEKQIMVGTQMVAKGHDFPNVTLVGVVLADIGLALPSYRSNERTFELLTQAVGRSGRAYKEGKAIIQTYNPHHYAITCGASQDYARFYKLEMAMRKVQQYPPFTYLIAVRFASINEESLIALTHKIAEWLMSLKLNETQVIGPLTPYIAYQKKKYHRFIVIKFHRDDKIKSELQKMLDNLMKYSDIDVQIDVDPYDY